MEYMCHNMNAYNLHIIKTNKFKTVTVSVMFRRKIIKEEITIRNLLKEILLNSSYDYRTERDLIIATENLYDLKLLASNYRIGNYSILSMKTRFLNEKYTEEGMNRESIKFLLDLIFRPRLDNGVDKCKKKLEKSIKSLSDNKAKYALFKLLEDVKDRPYSYNSYGYIDDIKKIEQKDIDNYYRSMIDNDLIDVFVVGDVDDGEIKDIFKEFFKVKTYHKIENEVLVPEIIRCKREIENIEKDNVNQTQLCVLCCLNGMTERERKYVLPVYDEMLGGSSNSILFENVRGKNSFAYYVNSIAKPYDNILMIYSGIDGNNVGNVKSIVKKSLKDISKGKIDVDKLESSKMTIVSAIQASLDQPVSIINNYYAKTLVNSDSIEERIKQVETVSKEEVMALSKKISIYSYFILEASNEENCN